MIKNLIVAGTLVVVALSTGNAMAQASQLVCTGTPATLSRTEQTVRLNLDSAGGVSLDSDRGTVAAEIESDNSIQLKFRVKQFEGEFFHYTGSLILIYPSGHLAQFTCSSA
jgi:hypothetical protein